MTTYGYGKNKGKREVYTKEEVDNKAATLQGYINNINNTNSNLQTQINSLASGSPLVADGLEEMTDTSKIYVYTQDGHWYWYNETSSNWTDGGVYQGIEIGDNTITPEKTTFANYTNICRDIVQLSDTLYESKKIPVRNHKKIYYYNTNWIMVKFLNENGEEVTTVTINKITHKPESIDIPEGSYYVCFRISSELIENIEESFSASFDLENIYEPIALNEISLNQKELKDTNYHLEVTKKNIDYLLNVCEFIYGNTVEHTFTEGSYVNVDGEIIADENSSITDFIEVTQGEKIEISTACYYNLSTITFFNKNKFAIGGRKSPNNNMEIETFVIEIPKDVHFIMCSCLNGFKNKFAIKRISDVKLKSGIDIEKSSILDNKTILFTGDSICYAAGERPKVEDYKNYGWVSRIQNNNPTSNVFGYGIGGTTIAKREGVTSSILERLDTMFTDHPEADYIIIQGGVNDSYKYDEIPLGEITNSYTSTFDEYTFCGALESLFKNAQLKWIGKKIGFIVNFKVPSAGSRKDERFYNYMQKAKEICEKWSVPYLDLFNGSNLNFYLDEIKQNYSDNNDGLHPNSAGYDVISPMIEKWIKTL